MKIKWIWINSWRYRSLNTYSHHVNKYPPEGMEELRETPMDLSKSMYQICYPGGKLSLCKLSTPTYMSTHIMDERKEIKTKESIWVSSSKESLWPGFICQRHVNNNHSTGVKISVKTSCYNLHLANWRWVGVALSFFLVIF